MARPLWTGLTMTKAKRDFHLEAMKDAVARMKPELIAASASAHAAKVDEEDADFDRIVELGFVTDVLSCLCAAHLDVMYHIAIALGTLHAAAEEARPELRELN
jgi:hypothetical protein